MSPMTDKESKLTLSMYQYYLTKTLKVQNLDETKVVRDSLRIFFQKYRSPYEFCFRGTKNLPLSIIVQNRENLPMSA
jgi:hypothetical protein